MVLCPVFFDLGFFLIDRFHCNISQILAGPDYRLQSLPTLILMNSLYLISRYDPRENVWHTITRMSIGRDAVSVATLGDRLVAIGGYDGTNYLSLTEIYDPVSCSSKGFSQVFIFT